MTQSVIIIDDKQENLFILEEIIKEHIPSIRVITALGARQGLSKTTSDVSLILSDHQMPEINGIELCRIIKSDPEREHIPFLLITAHQSNALLRVKGLEAGAMDFISRPIDSRELIAKVQVALNIYSSAEALRDERNCLSTEVQETGDQLIIAERRYKTLFESATDGILILSFSGKILDANAEAHSMLHFKRRKLIGMNIQNILPDESVSISYESVPASGVAAISILLRDFNGNSVPVDVRYRLVDFGDEQVILAIARDMTMQKEAENTIKESQERLDSALSAVRDGVIDWSIQNGKFYLSPRVYEMLGYAPDDFKSDYDSWAELIHPADRKEVREQFRNCLEGKGKEDSGLFSAEFRMKTKCGNWKWVLGRGQAVFEKGKDEAVRFIGTCVDQTERKRTEAFMIQSEKMISIGGLAAGMAHEINNPLAAVLGFAQNLQLRLMRDTKVNLSAAEKSGISFDSLQKYLEDRDIPRMIQGIRESGERAAKIISDTLSFSRKSDKIFSNHDLIDLLEVTLELASKDYSLKKAHDFRKIKIVREYDENVLPVFCNSNEIQQVLLNIIENAAHAISTKTYDDEKPKIIIRVYQDESTAVIEIEDNGPGIDEKTRKSVFEPFFTTKPVGEGTGLGLSVSCYIIFKNHKGSLAVESDPGNWTRFTIKLPVTPKMDFIC